jgi:anaerobic C4-dicarboxylate transporter
MFVKSTSTEKIDYKLKSKAGLSVLIFILATVFIILFGSVEGLRNIGGNTLNMPVIIEILMLSAAALILLTTNTNGIKAAQGSVFIAGMQAVVAIFGIAWMGDTFINGNMEQLRASIEGVVTSMPWIFGIALFVMSILLYSQAATVRALIPLGIALGISPWMLIALFPTVNGYFFLPNYPTVVAAINFDRTGTTRIGKWVLNHSFMLPGLVATIGAVCTGLLMIALMGK